VVIAGDAFGKWPPGDGDHLGARPAVAVMAARDCCSAKNCAKRAAQADLDRSIRGDALDRLFELVAVGGELAG
jgi:hypothetical protein